MPSSIHNSEYTASDYSFIPAAPSARRAPCPALNALANHGYIPRSGTDITFSHLLHAVKNVYNLSFPLAFLLTVAGFLTCAKFTRNTPSHEETSWNSTSPTRSTSCWSLPFSWTLDLADLSARGWIKIAHDASLVHPSGIPSHAPDPALLENLLSAAQAEDGMTLEGLAAVHVERAQNLRHPLDSLHEQIVCGECALSWLVMGNPRTGVIDVDTLAQWFGEERLPKGWWDESKRPANPVGLRLARKTADTVQGFIDQANHVS
ncbi:Chloroperoxidase [Mycena latifolia]|nr:Chloroperoxidase [Mycena latifolia]